MASVSAPTFPSSSPYGDSNPRTFVSRNPSFLSSRRSPPLKKSSSSSSSSSARHARFFCDARVSDSGICRCQNRSDASSASEDYANWRWSDQIQDVVRGTIKRFEDYVNLMRREGREGKSGEDLVGKRVVDDGDWDWERWKTHFEEVEEQEKIVSVLKSQLGEAIRKEDYGDAAKIKVAIAAVASNDTVGRVMKYFNRAIDEERYGDAAVLRDDAYAGLLGWWAGISEDSGDPYGRIVHISAEHGRYVAKNFSPRHLATAAPGVPLFEVFLTKNSKGEYKYQAVYLRRDDGKSSDSSPKFSKLSDPSGSLNSLNESMGGKSTLSAVSTEDMKDSEDKDDDSDLAERLDGFQNVLQDMIPGVKVTVLKVTAPEKVDRDVISKVIEQIMDEDDEDEDKDIELESVDTDDEAKSDGDEIQDEIEMDDGRNGGISEEQSEMSVKVVIGGPIHKLLGSMHSKSLLRVPAKLEKRGHSSFSFSIETNNNLLEVDAIEHASRDANAALRGQRSINKVMSDLAKSIVNRQKIPTKVLKDVEELINVTLSKAKNRQPLSGRTNFNRIDTSPSSDYLHGLYVGAHGLHTSEVIYLRRKFGCWQEDGVNPKSKFEFYEYVEALKLTGDPYVPAGQVAFRAKVGKQYQLPHKGIIPEEFGVVARYRGQGRLAEPGFQNPKWVDGELVILDGKYIKGGPVVGFVYWAPEYHFLVFFNQVKLPQ
ncbi:hypothetical protein Scep_020452 [Stephania cephalantha]|uniref:Protein EXECUTER 1, chloroplastic n=1 Tax=Stephania cephalantha TaxID=152367 RepID=A0AAP0ICQ6_9MAGN